jgi:hypothetical protein
MNDFNLKKYLVENRRTINSKLMQEELETTVEWKDVANILQKALSDVNSHDQYSYANPQDIQEIVNNLLQDLSDISPNM